MAKKRKYTKEEIQDYAKELYLEINPRDKKKKYTLQNIKDEIKAKFDKVLTRQTILNWSKQYEWDKLFVKNIQHNIRKAEQEAENEERDILSEKGKALKDLYKNHLILVKAGMSQLGIKLRDKELTGTELLRLVKDSGAVIMQLNELSESIEINIKKDTDFSKLSTEELLKLKELNEKLKT